MSSSIRSIRGLERTKAYFPVQALTSYGSFPYRDRESRLSPEPVSAYNRRFKQAADSAADWLAATREAQARLDQLLRLFGKQLNDKTDIGASLGPLSDLLNDLEARFIRHSGQLKPELWEAVERALLHPGAAYINLCRDAGSRRWQIGPGSGSAHPAGETPSAKQARSHSEPAEARRLKRLLLGPDGLLHTVKHAIAYGDRLKAIELLQLQAPAALPYAAYYESMHNCWPLPYSGLILNRYI